MKNIDVVNVLNRDQQVLVCQAINSYGKGGHPLADLKGLKFFTLSYMKQCLKKAIKDCAKCDMGSVIEKGKRAEKVLELLNKTGRKV